MGISSFLFLKTKKVQAILIFMVQPTQAIYWLRTLLKLRIVLILGKQLKYGD